MGDIRPTREDHNVVAREGRPLGLGNMPKGERDFILTPCPPRQHCKVCEGRLNAAFSASTEKGAKYAHQASNNGMMAIAALKAGLVDRAVALARRAGTYAGMVLEG